MNCPNCKIPLIMSDRQGIEIDYCPQCRGIWLDRGELDKIIERSIGSEPQSAYQPNQNVFGTQSQQGNYREEKKKHWLNELFD